MECRSPELEGVLQWYPISIKAKKEALVEKKLAALKLEVFLPWVRARRRVGARYRWILVPLFPGYIFCRLDPLASGKAVRYTPGIKDFVKFGNRFAHVEDAVVDNLRQRCPDGVARIEPQAYQPGEPITIKEGPLSGLEAVFDREMHGRQRVAVLLEFLGKQTRVVLSSDIIGRR